MRNIFSIRRLLLLLPLLLLSVLAQATHFRYGNITWNTVPGSSNANKRTVQLKTSLSFRRSYFTGTNIAIGSVVANVGSLNFGDNSSATISLTVTSVDVAADNFYGEYTVNHTYAANTNYKASYTSNARLSTLANNANGDWYLSTVVNAGTGNNSPVSTLPPVQNLAVGQTAATFQLPANDPDGDPLTYTVATAADVNNVFGFTNAPNLAVDATTGVVTFNTNTTLAKVGTLYNAIIKVSDGKTSILVDFLIQVTKVSTPPAFDYSVTPPSGYVYQVGPGTPVNFSVRATDSDAGDIVTLKAVGLPTGSSTSPALPLNGNPVTSAFSWTPTASNLGTYVLTFVAQDNVGVQTNTSVTIQVSTKPVFDVPPTPSNGSIVQITPGTLVTRAIQASNADPATLVRIISATGLATATYSPALPTTAANPTSTQLSWTPIISEWGLNVVTFTAQNNNTNDQKTHSLQFIVNSAPSFTSAPAPASLNVVAGRPFSYNITLTDPDLPYGDMLEIEDQNLPAWLTLTDNGDGTGTLSGTPAVSDAGNNDVTLVAADLYHHGASYGLITQQFTINVIPCTLQAQAQNLTLPLDASGNATITAAQLDNGSTATCGIATLALSQSSFSCANIGPNTVTLTVTDTYGNVSTATATVTVTDVIAPTAVAQNLTVQLDASGNAAITAAQVDNGSADACGTVSLAIAPMAFTCANVGPNTVTLTVTDTHGNVSTTTAVVTVADAIAPVAVAQNLTVQLDASGNATIMAAQVDNGSADACGIASVSVAPSTFSCANIGPNLVTLTVTDTHGNVSTATATVTVEDHVAPVALAKNLTVQLGTDGTVTVAAAQVDNGSSDACGIASISVSPSTFTCATYGANTVTLTVTDTHGNVSTATAVVTVTDATAPVALAKNITVPLSASGAASITAAQVNNSSTDNCGIASISVAPSTFSCANVGPNTVTLTVTDTHGNVSTTTATVTVTDVTAPTAVAQSLTVNLSASGTASITAAQVNNGSTDNCGIASISVAPMTFSCANAGANTVTLTVTDTRGNVGTATAIVTVRDNIAPTLSACPANVVVTAAANDCTPVVTWMAPVGADNCSFTLTSTAASGSRFPVGTTPVTYTATDASGNKATCSFMVTVKASPVVVTLSSATFGGGVNVACAGGTSGSATATVQGGCQPYRYLWSNGQTTATARNLAAGTYSVTVTDANNTSATQRITLTQSTPVVVSTSYSPQFTCVGGQASTIYLGYGLQYLTLSASATGGTSGYSYSWSPAAGLNRTTGTSVVASPRVTTVYTVTATDANGCSSSKQFTVYVYNVLCGNLDLKIAMCHNGREICVGIAAVPAQLLLGATLGSCTYGSNNSRSTGTLAESAPATTSATSTLAEKLTVEAFPNPSDGIFRVRLATMAAGHTKVQLYDLQGRVVGTVFEGELQANEQRELAVDLPGLAAGTYLLRVQSGAFIENLRVTVQH